MGAIREAAAGCGPPPGVLVTGRGDSLPDAPGHGGRVPRS